LCEIAKYSPSSDSADSHADSTCRYTVTGSTPGRATWIEEPSSSVIRPITTVPSFARPRPPG